MPERESVPGPSPGPKLTTGRARTLALEAGFSEASVVAIPQVSADRDARRFEQWVQEGRVGTMAYLERADEQGQLLRARVATPFPWARSVVACFASYESAWPRSTEAAPEGAGWIARYAWSSRVNADGRRRPSDYHKVLLKRVKELEAKLHDEFGEFETRAYVDTGPVVERTLATAAGLGWTGKNTCLIHPKLGSFGFLAVLVTSLQVATDEHPLTVPDRCGTCRRCLDACPTEALIAPYQMDATKCISYLTIEHRGEIAPELMAGMGRQVFGCDICQDVCPWNRKAPIHSAALGADGDLEPREELINPALEVLAAMDNAEFERRFNGSPVRRAGFDGLRRNVAIAMGNSGQGRFAPWLDRWSEATNLGLRTAAQWARKKVSSGQ